MAAVARPASPSTQFAHRAKPAHSSRPQARMITQARCDADFLNSDTMPSDEFLGLSRHNKPERQRSMG